MIIEKTIIVKENVTYNNLTHTSEFWACGYTTGTTQILLINSEDEPTGANLHIGSGLDGFGATSYAELLAEIINRGLIMPETD